MEYCISLEDIESWEYVQDIDYVYDIEVENNHNYFIWCDKPILVHNSGKTYSILQVLFVTAIENPNYTITVVGQDIPNLKRGAIRDASMIVNSTPAIASQIVSYNGTDKIYYFKNGSIIEFTSYSDSQDAKNGKRNIAFFNEANGIEYNVFNEVNIRTSHRTYIDYNPNSEFWVHEKLIGQPNVAYFISNFEHNPFISPNIAQEILRLKDIDPQLWRVYGLGQTGKIQGLVFDFKKVEKMPANLDKEAYGLDFGFTNDPTSLVRCGLSDGTIYVEELIYQKGLTNSEIVNLFKDLGVKKGIQIWADAADPKSIAELRMYGYNVKAASKGPDSIIHSIDLIKSYGKINITQNSTNLNKELLSYKWVEDRSGTLKNKPIDAFNHAIDALRYYAVGMLGKNKGSGVLSVGFIN